MITNTDTKITGIIQYLSLYKILKVNLTNIQKLNQHTPVKEGLKNKNKQKCSKLNLV